jgi:hypothetical protein
MRTLDRLNEEGLVERRGHPTGADPWAEPGGTPVVKCILDIPSGSRRTNQSIREKAFAGAAPGMREALIGALFRRRLCRGGNRQRLVGRRR